MSVLEYVLRRVERHPWGGLYRVVIGFCVVPAFARYRGTDGADWRVFPFFVMVLVMLRIVPAAIRHVVRFPGGLQARWFRQRLRGKRFDSYQWRKLVWFGLGIGIYIELFNRTRVSEIALAAGCLFLGSLGALAWRRQRRLARARHHEAAPPGQST